MTVNTMIYLKKVRSSIGSKDILFSIQSNNLKSNTNTSYYYIQQRLEMENYS